MRRLLQATDHVVQHESENAAWGAQTQFVPDNVNDSSDDEDCQTGVTCEQFPGCNRQEHLPSQDCRHHEKERVDGAYSGWYIGADEMRE